MGLYDKVKKQFEKDPEEDPDIDPSEKVGTLALKIFALFVIMFTILVIEWYYGYLFSLGILTVALCMSVIVGICLAILSILVMEKKSLLICDTTGVSGPIRKVEPIPLDIGFTKDGGSAFKVEWLSDDLDEDGNAQVVATVEYDGFDVYRGGLSYFFDTKRRIWYVVPRIIVRVFGFDGREYTVNYAAWKRSPIRLDINGKLHKYRWWEAVPEPFRKGLLQIPGFNRKRHMVRICFFPDVDFRRMCQIRVPIEVKTALEMVTHELDTRKQIEADIRQTAIQITGSLKDKKGEVEGKPTKPESHGYYGDEGD